MKKFFLFFVSVMFCNHCFAESKLEEIFKSLNPVCQSSTEQIIIDNEEYIIYSAPIHADFRLIMKPNAITDYSKEPLAGYGIVDSKQRIIIPCKYLMLFIPDPFRPCIITMVPDNGFRVIDWKGNDVLPSQYKYTTNKGALRAYDKSDDSSKSFDQQVYQKVLEQSKQ